MKMNFKPRIARPRVGSNHKDEAFATFYGQICCGTLEPVEVEQGEASTGIVEVATTSAGVGRMVFISVWLTLVVTNILRVSLRPRSTNSKHWGPPRGYREQGNITIYF